MNSIRQLWIWLAVLLVASFGVLLFMGRRIEIQAPPVPDRVVSQSGETVWTRADIDRGREVWQSTGGMQLGSVWGHGSYVAPDWTADWLHREVIAILDQWARRDFAIIRIDGGDLRIALAGGQVLPRQIASTEQYDGRGARAQPPLQTTPAFRRPDRCRPMIHVFAHSRLPKVAWSEPASRNAQKRAMFPNPGTLTRAKRRDVVVLTKRKSPNDAEIRFAPLLAEALLWM